MSDPGRKLIRALGAGKNNKTARSHFVFEKSADGAVGGKLLDKKMPVKPAERFVQPTYSQYCTKRLNTVAAPR